MNNGADDCCRRRDRSICGEHCVRAGRAEQPVVTGRGRFLQAWLRRAFPGPWCLTLLKPGLLMCAAFLAACDYPPEEVERMQQQLQAELSRGQVYVIHSQESLSYMIRNSDVTRGPESERERVVRALEKAALEFLAKYRNYEDVRIYFLGDGTTGINRPYVCRAAESACSMSLRQPEAEA